MRRSHKILFAIVIVLIYVIVGMLAPFWHQKEVADNVKDNIKAEYFYNDNKGYGVDRAKIVETNKEALDVRLDMIDKAQTEVILSTFDIRPGESTTDTFSKLLKAANRGVKVRILVDGLYGALHMNGEDIFKGVGSHKNIQIKFYNAVNPLLPWTVHGRLHDKYLVVDNKYLLMGGRNNFDYFLGDYKGKSKGLDRDIFIYNTGNIKISAVGQVKDYFQKMWVKKICKERFKTYEGEKKTVLQRKLLAHEKTLKANSVDYKKDTVPTKKATLVTNPTHIYGKEPYVFETMKVLMKNAKRQVTIHTPYAVFSKDMYEGITEIVREVPNAKMMVNSIASGDNICASADYYKHRDDILDTGITLNEYQGKYSTHGKSLIIDDDISVVGSYNFDCRSTYVDTETMLVVHGTEITKQLSKEFDQLESDALELDDNENYIEKKGISPRQIDKKKRRIVTGLSNVVGIARYLI